MENEKSKIMNKFIELFMFNLLLYPSQELQKQNKKNKRNVKHMHTRFFPLCSFARILIFLRSQRIRKK